MWNSKKSFDPATKAWGWINFAYNMIKLIHKIIIKSDNIELDKKIVSEIKYGKKMFR